MGLAGCLVLRGSLAHSECGWVGGASPLKASVSGATFDSYCFLLVLLGILSFRFRKQDPLTHISTNADSASV